MRKLVAVLLLALVPAIAQAQQIIQSGKPIPGHAGKWITNLTQGDAGPANGGPPGVGLTELNITSTLNNGMPFCINDVPITTPGGYHQICIGASVNGKFEISANSFGGAPQQGFNININGTDYGFPGVGGGMTGPGTTTVPEIASWNNTTGTLLRQGPAQMTDSLTGGITKYGSTMLVTTDGTKPPTLIGNYGWDAISGVTHLMSGSNLNSAIGVGGYVMNDAVSTGPSGPGSGNNGVALFSWGRSNVAGSWTWGINTNLISTAGLSAGTHLYNEFDLNASNANDTLIGLLLAGASTVQPVSAVGVVIGPQGFNTSAAQWTAGFFTEPGSSKIAMLVGQASSSGTNVASQPIVFQSWDNTGAVVNYGISGSATSLNFFGGVSGNSFFQFGGNISIAPGDTLLINNQNVVTNTTTIAQFAPDPSITQVTVGNNNIATAVSITGQPVLTKLNVTGGGNQPLCVRADGYLFRGNAGAC